MDYFSLSFCISLIYLLSKVAIHKLKNKPYEKRELIHDTVLIFLISLFILYLYTEHYINKNEKIPIFVNQPGF